MCSNPEPNEDARGLAVRSLEPDDRVAALERRIAALELQANPAAHRAFHLAIRDALVMIVRAYEGRFLPGLKKTSTGHKG